MPRGVMATAMTREDAERQVLAEAPRMRIVSSKEIDLRGIVLPTGPPPKMWAVVVEHIDPEKEAKLLQHADPEGEAEREARRLWTGLATDPESLVTGVIEEFPCPVCDQEIRLELPAPREASDPEEATCPKCGAGLVRPKGTLAWHVGAGE